MRARVKVRVELLHDLKKLEKRLNEIGDDRPQLFFDSGDTGWNIILVHREVEGFEIPDEGYEPGDDEIVVNVS